MIGNHTVNACFLLFCFPILSFEHPSEICMLQISIVIVFIIIIVYMASPYLVFSQPALVDCTETTINLNLLFYTILNTIHSIIVVKLHSVLLYVRYHRQFLSYSVHTYLWIIYIYVKVTSSARMHLASWFVLFEHVCMNIWPNQLVLGQFGHVNANMAKSSGWMHSCWWSELPGLYTLMSIYTLKASTVCAIYNTEAAFRCYSLDSVASFCVVPEEQFVYDIGTFIASCAEYLTLFHRNGLPPDLK